MPDYTKLKPIINFIISILFYHLIYYAIILMSIELLLLLLLLLLSLLLLSSLRKKIAITLFNIILINFNLPQIHISGLQSWAVNGKWYHVCPRFHKKLTIRFFQYIQCFYFLFLIRIKILYHYDNSNSN